MATPTNAFPIQYSQVNLTLISDSNGSSFYEATPGSSTKTLLGTGDKGIQLKKWPYKNSDYYINNPGKEYTREQPLGGAFAYNSYHIFNVLAQYYVDYSTGTPVNRTYLQVTETFFDFSKKTYTFYPTNGVINLILDWNGNVISTTTTTPIVTTTTSAPVTTTTLPLVTTSTTTTTTTPAPQNINPIVDPNTTTTTTSTTTTTTISPQPYYWYQMVNCKDASGYVVGPYISNAFKVGDVLVDGSNTNYYTITTITNTQIIPVGYSYTNVLSSFTKSNLTSCPTQITQTTTQAPTGGTTNTVTTPTIDQIVGYEFSFGSNFSNDIDLVGNSLVLNVNVNSLGNLTLPLGQNTDSLKAAESKLTGGQISFSLGGSLPSNGYFTYDKVFWAKKSIIAAGAGIAYYTDVSSIISADKKSITNSFQAPSDVVKNDGIGVLIYLKKQITAVKPTITVPASSTISIPDSQASSDRIITIPVSTTGAQSVKVYVGVGSAPKYLIPVDSTGNATIALSFLNDLGGSAGTKTIVAVPFSSTYGDGNQSATVINIVAVNDYPSITSVSYTSNIDIPTYANTTIPYKLSYTSVLTKYVNIELMLDGSPKPLQSNYLSTSYQILLSDLEAAYPSLKTSSELVVRITPYNISTNTINGNSTVKGDSVTVKTQIIRKPIALTKDDVTKLLVDSMRASIGNIAPLENKYLTHLASFDGTERLLISNWQKDNWSLSEKITDPAGNTFVTKEIKSIIIKLYGRLPDSIEENQTLWITKVAANPLVETVVLQEDFIESCRKIAGPNMTVDTGFVEAPTNYETIETLKLTSQDENPPIINTDDLNIKYYG